MFSISNNNIIKITRGDSAMITLALNIGTNVDPIYYSLQEGDRVYLGVMDPNTTFEQALIKKVFDINTNYTPPKELPDGSVLPAHIHIIFEAEDTLDLFPGVYYYSVKLFRPAAEENKFVYDKVDTIIDKRKFIIVD